MRFIHLSDLHLGKKVNEFPMTEDQKYILSEIIKIIDEEKPDALLIAGDIYDKTIPGEDAIRLWDVFLSDIAKRRIETFIINGNHDSAVRLSSYRGLIDASGIHLSPSYDGNALSFRLNDEHGPVNIHMLPFIKPSVIRHLFPDEEISDYTDAVRVSVQKMEIDNTERNVLIAHQYVTGAKRCESEEVVVGGLDNVDVSVFDDFDYVALGHLHGPQKVMRDTVRYSGSPLKYSFSEADHHKSLTVIDMREKGNISIRTRELKPLHDMKVIRGSYLELTKKDFYISMDTKDYIHAVLTDENDIPDVMQKLRIIYENIMKISYDNKRTSENRELKPLQDVERRSPAELFSEFYEMQNNSQMDEDQRKCLEKCIDSIWSK
ncbi:MAG: exonuclease SbcCD subunit D [Lachnospiraceae bacterium]|nr:exonuclease SbcCD subunit D [Lachnospiraceae bacterium]